MAALAGGIIASFARMSQKLGIARDDQTEKMLRVATELQNTDHWGRELEERLVAIGDVIAAMPGGKEMLEQKRVDLKDGMRKHQNSTASFQAYTTCLSHFSLKRNNHHFLFF
jgi:hypothetical protein